MARPPYPGRLHYFIGSKTRALVIERFAKHPEHTPYLRELGRDFHSGMGALHRELHTLHRWGLVRAGIRGGTRYYQLDSHHPIARALCALAVACKMCDECEKNHPCASLTRRDSSFIVDRRLSASAHPCATGRGRGRQRNNRSQDRAAGSTSMTQSNQVIAGTVGADPEQMALVARALSHPMRIRIVHLLAAQSECRGAEVFSELPLAQSTISEHLRVLKEAGLVSAHPVGTAMTYCLVPERIAAFTEALDFVADAPACDS